MSSKLRLDLLLVQRGFAESREKAQRLIRAGLVHTSSELLDKPGRLLDPDVEITVKGPESPYVSRGGIKLHHALETFAHNPAGQIAIDLGASTGGFTDCLLQHGAALVHAIDVGRGQLHQRLLNHPNVRSREKTHIDDLQAEQFDPRPQFAVADLSFISLRRAYPVLHRLLPVGGRAIVLVKPQFEAGREHVPKSGVVEDQALQRRILDELRAAAEEAGLAVRGECESPILGGEGNREFFLYLENK